MPNNISALLRLAAQMRGMDNPEEEEDAYIDPTSPEDGYDGSGGMSMDDGNGTEFDQPLMDSEQTDAEPEEMEMAAPNGSESPYQMRTMAPRRPTTKKQKFLSMLPGMLAGFVAGGATPNVAGGGMTDVFRAGMAGMGTVSRMQQEGRARQYQDARLATEQMNNENQQGRLMMQTQSQNSLREAQAEQYRAKARQIREMHNSGMLVIDRKGALQRQPDGTWKPVDFDTQNVIEAMAKFRAQLKKDGRTDEEINTLMDSKFYGYRKPAPAAPNASIVNAEKKEEKEKTLNERVGFYLRNSDNDPKKALDMAKADTQLPNDAFTQVEAELRKRIPKPPPAPKPNISAARYSDTRQDQTRANKYLAESGGDAKAAFEAATRAGDNAAATLIRPNIREEKKKSLFGSGPAAAPKLPPASGSGKGRVVVDPVTGKRTYVR